MERISKMWRSGLALVLAICMVIGVIPATAFAAESESDVLNYVSFGASNANGYGLSGYLPAGTTAENKDTANVYGYMRMPVDSYPYLLAEAMNEALGGEEASYNGNLKQTQPFTKVHVSQMAISSMRMEELRYLLDDTYEGDSYTEWRFVKANGTGWFQQAEPAGVEALRDAYAAAVENADVITLDMGINNFGVFMDRATKGLTDTDINAIDPEIAAEYAKAKAYVKNLVAQRSGEAALLLEGMDQMIDSLAYTLVGFCTSFDVVVEEIQKLNPNAKIVVVSIQNLLTGLSIEMEGFEEALPLGDIFGAVINAANLYTASRSPYADSYLYADVRKSGRVEFFVDALLDYSGDPADLTQNEIDCFTVYDNDLNVFNNVTEMVGTLQSRTLLSKLTASPYASFYGKFYGNPSSTEKLMRLWVADGAKGFTDLVKGMQAAVRAGIITQAQYNTTGPKIVAESKSIYNTYFAPYYEMALTLTYDVLAEIFQEGVQEHTINFAALSSPNVGNIEDALLAEIAKVVQGAVNAMAAAVAAGESYEFDLETVYPGGFFNAVAEAAGADATTVKSIACMGIRTGIGNSFYGHPTPAGHQEIKDVIWNVLENEITGKDVVENEVKIVLGELKDFLEVYAPNVADDVLALWENEGYVEQVETCIAELTEILEAREANYTDVVLPALNNTIDALEGQKEALTAELTVLKAQLEAKKAELEKVLAEQNIPGVSTPDLDIDVELGNNQQTTVPGNDCPGAGNTADELEAAVADLEHAIAVIEALIADITADINDMVALANDIIDAIASLEKTLTDIAAAAQALKDAVDAVAEVLTDDSAKAATETFINAFNTAREAALTAADALTLLVETVNADAAAIESAIDVLVNGVEVLFNKFVEDEDAYKQILLDNLTEDEQEMAVLAIAIITEALKENEDAIRAAIEAKKAELKAQLETELKALEEKYRPEIEAELKALEDKKAELEPQLKAEFDAKYAELTAKAEAEIAALEAAAAEKLAALEAELAAKQAELEALAEDAAEEVRAGIQAQIDRITTDIETVKADLICATEHVNTALKAAYDALVAELTEKYNQAVAELKAAYDAAVAEYEAAVKALNDAYDAAVKELEDAVDATIEEIKEQVRATIEEMKQSLIDLGVETVEDLVEAVTNLVKDILHRATHADLALGGTSTYVALGDGSAEAEGYVELLAERLQAQYGIQGYTNYAAAGNTVASVKANLGSYADLADADLITVGFSNVTMLNNAIANALEETPVAYDWTKLVGKELAPYVEEALAEVYAEIAAIGLDAEITEMLNIAIEGIAYGALEYAIELPQLIAAIREVNADAVIVILGQYDPMDGAVLKFGDVSVDVSEYIGYFVDGITAHGIAYCVLTGEAIFVEAPAVATANTDKELTFADLLKMAVNEFASMYPSTTGDTYITNQILEALNISKIPVVLWGDADSNGAITLRDAILILQAANGKDVALDRNASDVTGDGKITLEDAIRVLKRANGHTDLFPVEG